MASEGENVPGDPRPEQSELRTHERLVLQELAREVGAEVTLKGIEHCLSLQTSILSQALDGLADRGLVEDTFRGYRLTDQGFEVVGPTEPRPTRDDRALEFGASLPRAVREDRLVARLSRAIYKGMAYYGIVHGQDRRTLIWLVQGHDIAVRLRVQDGRFSIWTEGADRTSRVAALAAGGILRSIAKFYGIPHEDEGPPEELLTGTGFGS